MSGNDQKPKEIAVKDPTQADPYVRNKNGKPIFFADGSPLREGMAPQCTAKTSSSNYTKRCKRTAVHNYGYKVCQKHGAGSPAKGRPGGRPPKNGKYRLPPEVAKRHQKALEDPELLSLNEEIALVRRRMSDLAEQIFSEEFQVSQVDLVQGALLAKRAREEKDPEKQAAMAVKALDRIVGAIDPFQAGMQNWSAYQSMLDSLGKAQEREIARRKVLNNYITAEQAVALADGIVQDASDTAEEMIDDAKVRREFRNAMAAKVMLRLHATQKAGTRRVEV